MAKLPESVFDALEADAARQLDERLYVELRSSSPELCEEYADNELRDLVAQGHRNATLLSIETDRGIAAFVMMTLLCGPNFQDEPDIKSYLDHPQPDERIEQLVEYYLYEYDHDS